MSPKSQIYARLISDSSGAGPRFIPLRRKALSHPPLSMPLSLPCVFPGRGTHAALIQDVTQRNTKMRREATRHVAPTFAAGAAALSRTFERRSRMLVRPSVRCNCTLMEAFLPRKPPKNAIYCPSDVVSCLSHNVSRDSRLPNVCLMSVNVVRPSLVVSGRQTDCTPGNVNSHAYSARNRGETDTTLHSKS